MLCVLLDALVVMVDSQQRPVTGRVAGLAHICILHRAILLPLIGVAGR